MEERIVTRADDYQSQALARGIARLQKPGRKTVLDLGPPSSGNVTFFSQISKVFIADFFSSLTDEGGRARSDADAFEAACARTLVFPDDTRFDLVLAWDLFNYFNLDEIERLVRHLSQWCDDRTRIFALVAIYQKIPDRPFRFEVLDGGQLRYDDLSSGLRESPRHKEPDLIERMRTFQVEDCLLLRHGMREYTFAHIDAQPARAVGRS